MRTYQVFMLRFGSSVHFGDSGAGGGLSDVLPFCHADTFFSALCNEAVKIEKGLLEKLVTKTAEGKILFSDFMPWHCGIEGRHDLYIPRPFLSVSSEIKEKALSFADTKKDAIKRKKLKKRAYIRASQWGGYLNYMRTHTGEQSIDSEPEFGKFILHTHFNSRTQKPYECGRYYFMSNAGLYLVVAAEEKADLEWLETLILLLGHSGIGGRRSSGSGKFTFEGEPFILSEDKLHGSDAAALFKMLENDKAGDQMTLAAVIPSSEEMQAVCEGTGKLLKRSGFAFSYAVGKPVKENSIYMMSSGSCFKQRIAGTVADVNTGTVPHPVYRYGKGLYVGLSL